MHPALESQLLLAVELCFGFPQPPIKVRPVDGNCLIFSECYRNCPLEAGKPVDMEPELSLCKVLSF